MDEKHKADEIVHLNDLEFDDEEEEFSSFWYYDPTSARIEVSRNDIKKRRHLFQSPTNTWSIYVEYVHFSLCEPRFFNTHSTQQQVQ